MKDFRKLIAFYISLTFLCVLSSSAQTISEDPVSVKEQKTKEGYVVNLQDLIKKSKNKIEEVNQKIEEQAKRRRNQQREEKAKEYYEKAMTLFDEGKLEEAREYWDKAIKITEHPEMKDYIRDSSARAKKEEDALRKEDAKRLERLELERGYDVKEVEKKYQEAVALFKQEKYLAAKQEFDQVEEMFPDHKATRSYLMVIDQEIKKAQQNIIDKRLKEETVARQKEKEEWRKELEKRETAREAALKKQAEETYQQALKLYKAKQYKQAKDKFKEVEWIYPNYRDTLDYLTKADKDIAKKEEQIKLEQQKALERELREEKLATQEEREEQAKLEKQKVEEERRKKIEEANFVYKSAVTLYKNKYYVEAKEKFLEVDTIEPGYKSTGSYLEKIEKQLASVDEKQQAPKQKKIAAQEKVVAKKDSSVKKQNEVVKKSTNITVSEDPIVKKAIEERQKKFTEEAQIKYKEAIEFYKDNNLVEARRKFIQVEALYPDYEDTVKYLERIDEAINEGKQKVFKGVYIPEIDEQDKIKSLKAKTIEEKPNEINLAKERQEQTLQIYNQAINLFKTGQYDSAKERFIEVGKLTPGFKATNKYLKKIEALEKKQVVKARESEQITEVKKSGDSRITRRFEQQKQSDSQVQQEVKRVYDQAVDLYKAKQFILAKNKFTEVESLQPDYKSTRKYQIKINKLLEDVVIQRELERQLPSIKKDIIEDLEEREKSASAIEESYQQAIILFNAQQYVLAKEKLIQVNQFAPGYKDVKKYIKKVNGKISKQAKRLDYAQRSPIESQRFKQALYRAEDEKVMLTKKEQEELEWNIKEDEIVSKLRAQDEHQELVELNEYREFKQKQVDKETVLYKLDEERREYLKKRRQELLKELWAEYMANKQAFGGDEELVESKIMQEVERRLKAEELARQKAEEEKKILEEVRRQEEARKIEEKRIEAEKQAQKKEAERLAKERAKAEAKEKAKAEAKEKAKAEAREKVKEKVVGEGKVLVAAEEKAKIKKQKTAKVLSQRDEEKELLAQEKKEKKILAKKEKRKEKLVKKRVEEEIDIDRNELERLRAQQKKAMDHEQRKIIRSLKKDEKKYNDRMEKLYGKKAAKADKNEKEIVYRVRGRPVDSGEKPKKPIPVQKTGEKVTKEQKKDEAKVQDRVEEEIDIDRDAFNELRERQKKIVDKAQSKVDNSLNQEGKDDISLSKNLDTGIPAEKEKKPLTKKEQDKVIKRQKEAQKQALEIKNIEEKKKKEEKIKQAKIAEQKQKEENRKKEALEKQNKIRQKEELAKMRKDIEKIYEEALSLYKTNNIALSQEKFVKFEEMLNGNLPQDYVQEMRAKANKEKSKIQVSLDRQKRIKEEQARKREEVLAKEKVKQEEKRQKELAELEHKIKIEEEKLAKEKRLQELRDLEKRKELEAIEREKQLQLEKLKVKEASQLDKFDKLKEEKVKHDKETDQAKTELDVEAIKRKEKEKQLELAELIKQRQEELKEKREQIRKEYNENIESLYNKAVSLYRAGIYPDATRMFEEIETLNPNYKKTKNYLDNIEEKEKTKDADTEEADEILIKNKSNNVEDKPSNTKDRKDIIADALDSIEVRSNSYE